MRKTNAVNDKTMRCSVCNKPLIIKGTARMETLVDHVCNPNREIPLSDKYVCSDVHCVTHGVVFWDYDGETFTEHDKYEDYKRIKYILDESSAMNSLSREISLSLKKKVKSIYLKDYRVDFETTHLYDRADKIIDTHRGIVVNQLDKSMGGYIKMMGLSMLKYDVKSFFHHYKMQYGLIKLVNERLEWKNCEDNEFWRKFAIWWMPKVLRILQTKFITKLTKIQVK